MVGTHNIVIGFTSLIFGLLSIPIIYTNSFQWNNSAAPCLSVPYLPSTILGTSTPIILLAALLAAIAVPGIVGGFWRFRTLSIFYLVTALLPLALLALLVGFVFMATRGVAGEDQPSLAPAPHQLHDFPRWIRVRVEGIEQWEKIKGCLVNSSPCVELGQIYRIPRDFFNAHITPMQAGCCKPPTECGYSYGGPTYWSSANNTGAGMDCLMWSNNQTQLCYSCDSCKASLLAELAAQWKLKAYFLFAILCVLIVLYLVALGTFFFSHPSSTRQK